MVNATEPSGRRRRRWYPWLGGAVVVAAVLGLLLHVATAGPSRPARADASGATPNPPTSGAPTTSTSPPAPPLEVAGISPAPGASGVAGTTPIVVTFSAPLADSTAQPTLSPAVPGSWARTGPSTLTFTPSGAFAPFSTVGVDVPAGVRAKDGASTAAPVVDHFQVAAGSVLRVQELLAQLQYLPLTWTPTGPAPDPADQAGQLVAAFTPPAGAFAWRQAGWPTSLTSMWEPGSTNLITKSAIMAFESDHGLHTDGVAGSGVWAALLQASASHQLNSGGYSYALGSKTTPQSLTIWHDGNQVLQSPANMGIAQAGTSDGTFPVYERLRSQTMQGTNPDGSHYADPVQYVAYFDGGEAVHYIPRANYGDPQSLGCIELPLDQAAAAWPYLSLGTLVTVTG